MHKLGTTQLIASTEAEERSVWVGEDDAPTGVAGYYEKRRIPVPYKIGGTRLTFRHKGIDYDLQCKGLEQVVEVLKTLLRWEEERIASLTEGLRAFAKEGDEWWRVLRVAPDATEGEIRAAFHRLARDHHPDRGGDAEAFKQLQRAYEQACDTLSAC